MKDLKVYVPVHHFLKHGLRKNLATTYQENEHELS